MKSIRETIDNKSDDLTRKEKELESRSIEIKELDDKLKEIKANASQTQILRKTKYVQTSLFESSPKNKEAISEHLKNLVNYFKKFDIDTLTPNDLKAKLYEIKKKIENNS